MDESDFLSAAFGLVQAAASFLITRPGRSILSIALVILTVTALLGHA